MPNLIGGIVLGYIWNLIINGVLEHFGVDITFAAKYGFWGFGCINELADDRLYDGYLYCRSAEYSK